MFFFRHYKREVFDGVININWFVFDVDDRIINRQIYRLN